MPIRVNRRMVDQEISRRMKKVEDAVAEQLSIIHAALNDEYLLPNLLQAVETVKRCQHLKHDDLYEAVGADDFDDLEGAVENCSIALQPLADAVQTIRYILDHATTRQQLEVDLTSDPLDDPT